MLMSSADAKVDDPPAADPPMEDRFKIGQKVTNKDTKETGVVEKADYQEGKIHVKLSNGQVKEYKPSDLDDGVERSGAGEGVVVGMIVQISGTPESGTVESIAEKDGSYVVSVKLTSGKIKEFKPSDLDYDHTSVIGLHVHTKDGMRGVIEKTTETKDGKSATIKTVAGHEEVKMEELLIGKLIVGFHYIRVICCPCR
jgi:hypothetical protein